MHIKCQHSKTIGWRCLCGHRDQHFLCLLCFFMLWIFAFSMSLMMPWQFMHVVALWHTDMWLHRRWHCQCLNLRMGHVENGTTYCVRFCAWAWTWHMLCFGTSIETCNNLSITFCQVSYTTSISLSEHEQNALRTCTEYWFQCVKRSSNFESRRERCQLGHLRIFSSVFTSSCHRVIPKPSSSGMCHAMLLLFF